MKPFMKVMWRRRKESGLTKMGVNLNVVVAPMLDMSFLLLSFFIITYDPISMEGHIDGSLLPPPEKEAKGKKKDPPKVVDIPPEVDETLTVWIKAVKEGQKETKNIKGKQPFDIGPGQVSRILLVTPDNPEGDTIVDSDDSLADGLRALQKRLETFLSDPITDSSKLKIRADGNLKQQYIIMVYDYCKRARHLPKGAAPSTARTFADVSFISPLGAPEAAKE